MFWIENLSLGQQNDETGVFFSSKGSENWFLLFRNDGLCSERFPVGDVFGC